MPTIQAFITDARRRLERAGIAVVEAALDADVLARHALGGWERGQLLACIRDGAPPEFAAAYERLVGRRERREPAAYIVGTREFWNLDIEVTPGVLVPRPETEFVVEEALARLTAGAAQDPSTTCDLEAGAGPLSLRIADVGTGSGCLAIALARWLPGCQVVATDLSDAALAVAARNAVRHDVAHQIQFVRTDLLDGITGPFHAIVSNPPYVPSGDVPSLQPEVRHHEPVGALDGGPDGLDVIRHLVPSAASRLATGGWLLFEFSYGQVEAVRALVASEPRLCLEAVRDDLAGIPRVAVARRRSG
jgi:release factor glutamine methyltransferase